MEINSLTFLAFFIIVFFVYYLPLKGKGKAQNFWLLICSYFSYGVAEWKMVPLLLFATLAFYGLGIAIEKCSRSRERLASWLTVGGTTLGICLLVYFKYLNFFIDSFIRLMNGIGFHTNGITLHILMPLGISFFTFKLISYLIEVHRRHIEPCTDFVAFATYISFFPTILSGPIDRPNAFLPQLREGRLFQESLAADGCRQILWGLFKKCVIADNLAFVTASSWSNVDLHGSAILIVVLLFPLQLYADFSGYSDMAIGVGKLLGLRIAKNFNYPFFALNIAEYWRRWHISLTSWLTDYVFIPLNLHFRDWGKAGVMIAIFINLVLIGMWHGANLTFVVFGVYHGILFLPLIASGSFMKKTKLKAGKWDLPPLKDILKMTSTYLLVSLGLMIFVSSDLHDLIDHLSRMTVMLFQKPRFFRMFALNSIVVPIFFIIVMLLMEWKSRKQEYALCLIDSISKRPVRFLIYVCIVVCILVFKGEPAPFIYFQF